MTATEWNPPRAGRRRRRKRRFLSSRTLAALAITPGLLAFALDAVAPQFALAITLLASAGFVAGILFSWENPRRAQGLLSFAPAVPIAFYLLCHEGVAEGSHLLAAAAFAGSIRVAFFWLAGALDERRQVSGRKLENLPPPRVRIFVDNDIESEVELESLQEGHVVRLLSGDVVPADGTVTYGSSFVDESFTGPEAVRLKGMGSTVFAGSRNKNGTLLFRVSAVGKDTFLARLARRTRAGEEMRRRPWLMADLGLTLLCAALLALLNPEIALRVFLVSSGASIVLILAIFETGLLAASLLNGWRWRPGGLARVQKAGMALCPAGGVLTEGRPRLMKVACQNGFSEDAAMSMIGPLARKIESPAAYSLLQELRSRNIPLEQSEFFHPAPGGGIALIGGEEFRYLDFPAVRKDAIPLGELKEFVEEQAGCGHSLILARNELLLAALAFEDPLRENLPPVVKWLEKMGKPLLLVSSLSRAAAARLQQETGIQHCASESGPAETEALLHKLGEERLLPLWLQPAAFRPGGAAAVVAAAPFADGADLATLRMDLPGVAPALAFARSAMLRIRSALCFVLGCQLALALVLIASDERVARLLGLGDGSLISDRVLVFLGVLPGLLVFPFVNPYRSPVRDH